MASFTVVDRRDENVKIVPEVQQQRADRALAEVTARYRAELAEVEAATRGKTETTSGGCAAEIRETKRQAEAEYEAMISRVREERRQTETSQLEQARTEYEAKVREVRDKLERENQSEQSRVRNLEERLEERRTQNLRRATECETKLQSQQDLESRVHAEEVTSLRDKHEEALKRLKETESANERDLEAAVAEKQDLEATMSAYESSSLEAFQKMKSKFERQNGLLKSKHEEEVAGLRGEISKQAGDIKDLKERLKRLQEESKKQIERQATRFLYEKAVKEVREKLGTNIMNAEERDKFFKKIEEKEDLLKKLKRESQGAVGTLQTLQQENADLKKENGTLIGQIESLKSSGAGLNLVNRGLRQRNDDLSAAVDAVNERFETNIIDGNSRKTFIQMVQNLKQKGQILEQMKRESAEFMEQFDRLKGDFNATKEAKQRHQKDLEKGRHIQKAVRHLGFNIFQKTDREGFVQWIKAIHEVAEKLGYEIKESDGRQKFMEWISAARGLQERLDKLKTTQESIGKMKQELRQGKQALLKDLELPVSERSKPLKDLIRQYKIKFERTGQALPPTFVVKNKEILDIITSIFPLWKTSSNETIMINALQLFRGIEDIHNRKNELVGLLRNKNGRIEELKARLRVRDKIIGNGQDAIYTALEGISSANVDEKSLSELIDIMIGEYESERQAKMEMAENRSKVGDARFIMLAHSENMGALKKLKELFPNAKTLEDATDSIIKAYKQKSNAKSIALASLAKELGKMNWKEIWGQEDAPKGCAVRLHTYMLGGENYYWLSNVADTDSSWGSNDEKKRANLAIAMELGAKAFFLSRKLEQRKRMGGGGDASVNDFVRRLKRRYDRVSNLTSRA